MILKDGIILNVLLDVNNELLLYIAKCITVNIHRIFIKKARMFARSKQQSIPRRIIQKQS